MTVLLDDGGEEIVIAKHFLYYNYDPIPKKGFSGEPRKDMYLMASVGTFRYSRNYLLSSDMLDKATAIFDTRDPHYKNLGILFGMISGVIISTCDINDFEEDWMKGLVEAAKQIRIDHFTELIEEIMIKLCNTDNMFELCDLAEEHQLKTALVKIVISIEQWQHILEGEECDGFN
ncbi:unnamed protein product [Orchesella dallaii]|uniref:Uncharacterized protein n=1 Tax=Orchesella dallaii TaxID=48710 RepID=A0ABP1R954_9HEXA